MFPNSEPTTKQETNVIKTILLVGYTRPCARILNKTGPPLNLFASYDRTVNAVYSVSSVFCRGQHHPPLVDTGASGWCYSNQGTDCLFVEISLSASGEKCPIA